VPQLSAVSSTRLIVLPVGHCSEHAVMNSKRLARHGELTPDAGVAITGHPCRHFATGIACESTRASFWHTLDVKGMRHHHHLRGGPQDEVSGPATSIDQGNVSSS
jgi:hypothetical protein